MTLNMLTSVPSGLRCVVTAGKAASESLEPLNARRILMISSALTSSRRCFRLLGGFAPRCLRHHDFKCFALERRSCFRRVNRRRQIVHPKNTARSFLYVSGVMPPNNHVQLPFSADDQAARFHTH